MTRCGQWGRLGCTVDLRVSFGLLAILVGCKDAPVEPATSASTIRLCNVGTWLAYRNDGGEWAAAEVRDGVAEFVPTARVSLAYGDVPNARPYLTVEFLTADEAQERHTCSGTHLQVPGAGTFSGEVRGVIPGDRTSVLYGSAISVPSATADSTAMVYALPVFTGFNDLFAVRRSRADTNRVDRLIVRRAPQLSAGTVINLDFGSGAAAAPAHFTLSVNETVAALRESYRSTYTSFTLYDGAGSLAGTSHQLLALPGAMRVPDDRYEISLTSVSGSRTVTAYVRDPVDMALSFGPDAAAPSITEVASAPVRRLRFDVPIQAEYGGSVEVTAFQSPSMSTVVALVMTREFLVGTPSAWAMTMPDLSAVPGVPSGLGLQPGPVMWQVRATSGTLPEWPTLPPDGLIVRSSSLSGFWPN